MSLLFILFAEVIVLYFLLIASLWKIKDLQEEILRQARDSTQVKAILKILVKANKQKETKYEIEDHSSRF